MASADLKSTTVLVTGAGGGLGKAIASAFLAAGGNAAICDVNQERLSATEAEWAAQHDAAKFFVTKADVTSEADVDGFVSAAVARFGRVDMVVNNAAVMDHFDPAGSTDKEVWDRVMGINLTGPFLVTRAAVKAMAEAPDAPGGTIVNICSVAGLRGVNAGAAYTASKHGLLGLTRNTAGFYGDRGVSCVALVLGGMEDTNVSDAFAQSLNQDGMARMMATNPGYVPGKTTIPLTDVAKYCLFLADRNIAAASNGSTITVNKNWPAA